MILRPHRACKLNTIILFLNHSHSIFLKLLRLHGKSDRPLLPTTNNLLCPFMIPKLQLGPRLVVEGWDAHLREFDIVVVKLEEDEVGLEFVEKVIWHEVDG